jgi:hypothetical protein
MNDQQPSALSITPPPRPKGGGAIQSIGKGWGAVGPTGAASFDIPLPLSPGRGFVPSLSMGYSSAAGNGSCGMGWGLTRLAVARRSNKGVPAYEEDDEIVGPSGDVWMPERDPATGALIQQSVDTYRGLALGQAYQVCRHWPRVEGAFERIERWRVNASDPGFWLVHGADGSLHLYGKRTDARIANPAAPEQVAEWLLEESLNPIGEHVLYEYLAEDNRGLDTDDGRDHQAQRYLHRVRYGNLAADSQLYLWDEARMPQRWHFDLLFDYGERATEQTSTPDYGATHPWPVRPDPCSRYEYGFEIRTLRRCHQVLMFHDFSELGDAPLLVRRLWLEYGSAPLGYSLLTALVHQGYTSRTIGPKSHPPVEFSYGAFDPEQHRSARFEPMPGLNDGQAYQLVDLYGEGMPGVLFQHDQHWWYREPQRDTQADDPDAVSYAPWRPLPTHPNADSSAAARQFLSDLTGDGRLDWIVAQPGVSGFFTLGSDRRWSGFASFPAFPQEFFHPQGQMADLMGDGLSDLALIGPRSVRLYANRREQGFAPASEVPHDGAALPLLSDSPAELVAFSDPLGSGQQHLIRIRHDRLTCWPNLGRGNFGAALHFADLPFSYSEFDAANVRLADLDGSGAADLLYLTPDHLLVFMNRGGNGFAEPYRQPWPEGLRYDRFCQVSVADLQGLGCSSLVITAPHMQPRHWRLDFVHGRKPYLLSGSNNNMGAASSVEYRSSAQFWLDEKQELLATAVAPVCEVPFPVHMVSRQQQHDEITDNRVIQTFTYRQGYYDGYEREFRGFGLLLQTDAECPGGSNSPAYSAPALSKSWFHTGRPPDHQPAGFDTHDTAAIPLGRDLLTRFAGAGLPDAVITTPGERQAREMARALAGSLLRTEVFGLDDDPRNAVPYSVQQSRYGLREVRPADDHQRYAVLLPQVLESISYTYERIADDPLVRHTVNLRSDAFGQPEHSVDICYPRRKHSIDNPPFDDEYEQTWWRDAFDDAQHAWYFSEALSQAIHLQAAQSWRLGLPFRQRGNAWIVPKAQWQPAQMNWEDLSAASGPLAASAPRELAAQSLQRYQGCALGEANFEALTDYLEMAELDETAMQAYDRVMTRDELREKLAEIGYTPMLAFFPEDSSVELWSVNKGFTEYGPPEHFYRPHRVRETRSHGWTAVEYDPYGCFVSKVTAPDGCATRVSYDYRALQPHTIVDPNQNSQQATYDAFGQVGYTSFFGTERGEAVGFAPLGQQLPRTDIEVAIRTPRTALGDFATAYVYEYDLWMGSVPRAASDPLWLAEQIAAGNLTTSGYLRASARARLGERGELTGDFLPQASAYRQPVRWLMLQADRYPGDPELQYRMSLAAYDGFGRTLQSKQRVEPGQAYTVDSTGVVIWAQQHAPQRWRVSERVEYNDKGLATRVYRPYFLNDYRYANDKDLRKEAYHDQQYYDPLGRPTEIWTAAGWLRRVRYLTWYTINEDENDTAEEVENQRKLNRADPAG